MTIGEKIKYFRTLHGFTQDQLIQATGLSISTLQKYESDERKPKPEQLLKISQALGISINVFMDFDIHTVSDLLSLIFKMNEQLDLNQKLSTYVAFLNKMADSEKGQYTQALQELENQLLDDSTDIQKAAPIKESSDPPSDSAFSDPSYQKIQHLLSDCTPQEIEWILKSVQLIKECMRNTSK